MTLTYCQLRKQQERSVCCSVEAHCWKLCRRWKYSQRNLELLLRLWTTLPVCRRFGSQKFLVNIGITLRVIDRRHSVANQSQVHIRVIKGRYESLHCPLASWDCVVERWARINNLMTERMFRLLHILEAMKHWKWIERRRWGYDPRRTTVLLCVCEEMMWNALANDVKCIIKQWLYGVDNTGKGCGVGDEEWSTPNHWWPWKWLWSRRRGMIHAEPLMTHSFFLCFFLCFFLARKVACYNIKHLLISTEQRGVAVSDLFSRQLAFVASCMWAAVLHVLLERSVLV